MQKSILKKIARIVSFWSGGIAHIICDNGCTYFIYINCKKKISHEHQPKEAREGRVREAIRPKMQDCLVILEAEIDVSLHAVELDRRPIVRRGG